jgi:hypothetical protein
MNDVTVIYGKKKPFNRDSFFLFEISGLDRSELRSWSLELSAPIYRWLRQNEIAEDDAMLFYYSLERPQTCNIAARCYLHLDRDEHRVLFRLCNDDMMNAEEDPT